MRRDPANVLQLLGDAVESMLDGYQVDWLRDDAGMLMGFQVKLANVQEPEPAHDSHSRRA
jgi:hypothetical protein